MPYIEGLILCKREKINGAYEMQPVALGYEGAFTDVSEQVHEDLDRLPLLVVHAEVSPAVALTMAADNRFIVVGSRRVNDDGSHSNSTFDDALTLAQRNAFRTWVATNYPNAPAAVLSKVQAAVQTGDTRWQAFKKLSAVLRRYADLER